MRRFIVFLCAMLWFIMVFSTIAFGSPEAGTWNELTLGLIDDFNGLAATLDPESNGGNVGDVTIGRDDSSSSSPGYGYYWYMNGLIRNTLDESNIVDNEDGTGTRTVDTTRSGGTFYIRGDNLWDHDPGTIYTATIQSESSGLAYFTGEPGQWEWDRYEGLIHIWGYFNEDPYLFDFTATTFISKSNIHVWSNEYNSWLIVANLTDVEMQIVLVDICECDLNVDGKCDMQDWLLFGEDWGCTDCGTPPGSGDPPNDCECDLNTDGKCDMQDWLLFGEDWGRTDCNLEPPNELWVSRYNGPGNDHDVPYVLALDAGGNVYVTGWSWGDGTDYDYATIKYDTDGKQLWVQRYNGPVNGEDHARTLAVDSAGNVYVTGYSYGSGTETDYATIKYDTDGDQLWVQRYNGPGNGYDSAEALAVDAAGSVYVAGSSWCDGTDYDYAIIKYDTDGKQLWVQRYNGPGNGYDSANSLTVDAAGNVYVVGSSYGSGTGTDCAFIKYDTDGKQLWVQRYNGPQNGSDYAGSLALDAAGNVYITGYNYGSGTEADYITIKYGYED